MRWLSCLGLIACCTLGARGEELVLKGRAWSVTVDPRSLEVSGQVGGAAIRISSPIDRQYEIADVKREAHSLAWSVPSAHLKVQMRLDDDVLLATFEFTAESGEISWPVLHPTGKGAAFILPMFEGVYVPADDAPWAQFLEKQGPLNTTSDLSMPFVGTLQEGRTLTYLLDNPFNNELAFTAADGRLGATLTHSFTRNHAVKECSVRVMLGDGSPVEPARVFRRELIKSGQFVSMAEKIRRTPDAAKLLGAAHVYLWGDGHSPKMLTLLSQAGLDRLWLGSPDWAGLRDHADMVKKAIDLGYLIGPYDSFHSIHRPGETDTWETAQFDQKLYDTGGVILADGRHKTGFKKKGYILNAGFARPWVGERVRRLMAEFRCNSWFVDCDAAGELYDDYSAAHPATQRDDMKARVSRMGWIVDTFHAVVGSEGGSSYAAGVIHFAHGEMTPVIGWGDPALTDRKSPYYLGGYYPPDGPACFFKQVPMKPEYHRIYSDAHFRLPLYQVAFHDSVVTTHQWGFGSLKFKDEDHTRELLELLYNVPPLYHLNTAAWKKQKDEIVRHYAFFSPLHRQAALMPMMDFQWLTDDHLVQRTRFGDKLEMVGNFGDQAFDWQGTSLPAHSILARGLDSGGVQIYSPGDQVKR